MKRQAVQLGWVWGLFLLLSISASAGVTSSALRETMELVLRKFGREVAQEGAEQFARRVEQFALKYGDDALAAVRNVGPRALRLADEAGEAGVQAVRILARHGDEGIWLVSQPSRLAWVSRYGDDAAAALIKHGEVAEPLLSTAGKSAAEALQVVSTQNGRRLAMMSEEGALRQMGRTEELFAVVRRHGDSAMEFIWRNKGALTVAAGLTAFLAQPEAFIDGTVDLGQVLAEQAVAPVASQVAERTNWTIVLGVLTVVLGLVWGLRVWQTPRPALERP